MNKTFTIIYLIIIFVSNWNLYSNEIVITIPDKYNNKTLPLPPFPKESLSRLEVVDENILDDITLRTIGIKELSYRYLPEFLTFSIDQDRYYEQSFFIGTDLKTTEFGYSYSSFSNLNSFTIGGDYSFIESEYDLNVEGSIYNSVVDLNSELSLGDKSLLFEINDRDYYTQWSINLGYITEGFNMDLLYDSKNNFHPFFELGYHYGDILNGSFALGSSNVSAGVSYLNSRIYPYLKMDWGVVDFITIKEEDEMDYSVSFTPSLQHLFSIKTGLLIDDYTVNTPYLSIEEDIFWGSRVYTISYDNLSVEFNFINNLINTIITVTLSSEYNYLITLDFSWMNIWSIIGEFEYTDTTTSLFLGFNYTLEEL